MNKESAEINIITKKSECFLKVFLLYDIYIYIYIFTNLISTSIHGIRKTKKPWSGTRDKSTSNHRPGEKEKVFWVKKKEKASLVRLLEKNQGVRSQWSKENQKTLCECCKAIITRVELRLPDDPLR